MGITKQMTRSLSLARTSHLLADSLLRSAFTCILLDALWINATGAGAVVSAGFYTFHFIDVATPLLVLFFISSPLNIKFSPGLLLVGALLTLTALSFFRGVIVDPFQAAFALRERSAYFLFALALLTSRTQGGSIKLLLPPMIIYALSLVALFVARSIYGPGLFLNESGLDVLESNELRLLNADAAMFLSLMAAMLFTTALQASRGQTRLLYNLAALLFIAVELLTRQRTATVATAVGFATLLLGSPRLLTRTPAWAKIFGGVALACTLAAFITLGPSRIYSALPSSFQRAAEKRGTLTFRQVMWAAAAKSIEEREPVDLLVGIPSGQRPPIYFLDQRWSETLHSFYVETAFDFGLCGLVALLAAMAWGFLQVFAGLIRGAGANSLGINPSLCLCWLVELAIFGYSYDLRSSLSLFLFSSLAATAHEKRAPQRKASKAAFRHAMPTSVKLKGRQAAQSQWRDFAG